MKLNTSNKNAPFRDPRRVQTLRDQILRKATRKWVLMEMCGGQTHAILKDGLDELLSPCVEFVHGPGCPVCVTALVMVDKAIALAKKTNLILASYGDMLRVPGTEGNLFAARANGADVRIVYSALDALKIARENPEKEVVFFGIGFETTAPANGISVLQASRLGLRNYAMLVSQVCVPPALELILNMPGNRVQGFLAAGHVCAVMGTREYEPISRRWHVPISVAGFEPLDLLLAVDQLISALEADDLRVSNAYGRGVSDSGNPAALALIEQLYEPCDREWRGIGAIPASGWRLKPAYAAFDAEKKYALSDLPAAHGSGQCIAGAILQGIQNPPDCPLFGSTCTPENPLGATMVSGEGTCAAYYRYRRHA